MQLKDRSFLITGGASGRGAACCQALAVAGARVAIADVGRSTAESLAASMGAPGVMMTEIAVSRSGQVARSVNEVGERFGRVNILVNCAGVFRRGNIEDTSISLWRDIMGVNLESTFSDVERLSEP